MLAHREKIENPITHQMSKQYTRMRESKSHHNKTVHGFNHAIKNYNQYKHISEICGFGLWQMAEKHCRPTLSVSCGMG